MSHDDNLDRRTFHRRIGSIALGASLSGLTSFYPLRATSSDRDAGSALPTAEDTILSPRTASPSALDAVAAYHPTRVEWHYASSAQFVQAMRAKGVKFISGTINSTDVTGADVSIGIDGAPNVAPWMRGNTKHAFISSSSPRTRQALAAWVQRNLDFGVDAIVYDDPLPLASAETWGGGDYSPGTEALFQQWLEANSTVHSNYKSLLSGGKTPSFRSYLHSVGVDDIGSYKIRRVTDPTLIAWRNFLLGLDISQIHYLRDRTYRGVPHPMFTGNLNTPHPSEQAERLMPLFDYFTCEINSDAITDVYIAANMLATRGKPLVASSQATSDDTRTIQHSVAAAFAVGAIPVIPWDTYVPPHGGLPFSRYYGRTADFEPLFAFFRRNAALLKDYRQIPHLGIVNSIGQTPAAAFRNSVEECIRWGVPFRVVTCGGEMQSRAIRAVDLQGLRALVDPVATGSISGDNARLAQNAGVPLTRGGNNIRGVASAFFADPTCDWCAISRSAADGQTAYFIVPRKYGAQPIAAGTRLMIKNETLPTSTATLLTLEGRSSIPLENDTVGLSAPLPEIDMFAVILV